MGYTLKLATGSEQQQGVAPVPAYNAQATRGPPPRMRHSQLLSAAALSPLDVCSQPSRLVDSMAAPGGGVSA